MKHDLGRRLVPFFSTLALLVPAIAAQAQELPPAREILDRYAAVTKSAEVLAKTSSIHQRGTFSLPGMGLEGAMEVWSAKPDLHLMSMELGAIGKTLSGYDGTTAWAVQPMVGARLLSDVDLLQAKLEAAYDAVLKPAASYESMRTVGRQTFEGKDCYKVEMVAKPLEGMDAEQTKAVRTVTEYYEVATGLLVGTEARQGGEMGESPITMIASDYKELGGQLVATKTLVRAQGQEFVITIDSVEFDTATASTFTPPPEIQKLVEAAKAKAASSPAPKPQ